MARPIAGEEYVQIMTSSRRWERQLFQRIALTLVPPGSNIFDFGSGPGLDAKVFAESGHKVLGYDPDVVMREYFAQFCAEHVKEGRVSQREGTYDQFLSSRQSGWADLITSNYAPLNLIADLPTLFERFHELSRAKARVVASVLNPLSIFDCRYRWWWKNLGSLIRYGEYYVQGSPWKIFRRSASRFAEQAAPFFRLVSTIPNTPSTLRNLRLDDSRFSERASRPLVFSRYMILVFERIDT